MLVASDAARSAVATGVAGPWLPALQDLYAVQPSMDLLQAIDLLDADPGHARQRHTNHLAQQPTLSAAAAVLHDNPATQAQATLLVAVERAAKPLQRYRCAACGFEAQHYFWQCPGCLSWDSYPPQRVEDM